MIKIEIVSSCLYLLKDVCPYTENSHENYITLKGDKDNDYNENYKFFSHGDYKYEENLGKNDGNHEDNPEILTSKLPFLTPYIKDKFIEVNNFTNLGKTSSTSLALGQKRAKPDGEKCDTEKKSSEEKKKTNCGRKKKGNKEKRHHNQLSEDNIIRKIKSNYLKYSHNEINQSFENKNIQFLKLDSDLNENLKKDYNEKLMNKTFKELYETYPVSSKYRKQKTVNCNLNKKIIRQIYSEENEEKKEYTVIRLLNSTYLELFKVFRNNHLKEFLDEMKKILVKNGESEEYIKQYLEKIERLCMNYEDWFFSKNGRNREKKKNNL